MTGEKGMFPRHMEDFANFAVEGPDGTAFLTRIEREKVFELVVNTLHDEDVHLNYSESESGRKDFPVKLTFLPPTMAGRVVRMINAHPANFY